MDAMDHSPEQPELICKEELELSEKDTEVNEVEESATDSEIESEDEREWLELEALVSQDCSRAPPS